MYNEQKLLQLDNQRNKTTFVKITTLTFKNELPIESLEGQVQSGSISLDGKSSVRRTCQLSLIVDKGNVKDKDWAVKTKFKLEIGLLDDETDEIVWFNKGIFVITSFSHSRSTNSESISISGKDKMCLLNGEFGGALGSSVDFGQYDEIMYESESSGEEIAPISEEGEVPPSEGESGGETGTQTPTKDLVKKTMFMPVKDIIREAVHTYGGEGFHKIIINDLSQNGYELLEYRYDSPLYLLRKSGSFEYTQMQLEEPSGVSGFDSLIEGIPSADPEGSSGYYAAKIEYGQTAGYRETELTYPGELIANAGEALTSVLDKIKNFLGPYEYFYDVDGNFVFQKRPDAGWSPIEQDIDTESVVESNTPYSYIFDGTKFFTTFNISPKIDNIKNDFSIWGACKSITGKEIPAHLRYAIDVKPKIYTSISVDDDELNAYNDKYGFNLAGQSSVTYVSEESGLSGGIVCDWREIIYQMAKDFRKYNHLDDFELKVAQANSIHGLYSYGRTGYEQYYIDMEGFWRLLYYPSWETKAPEDMGIMNQIYDETTFFNLNLKEAPEHVLFYFDFLDSQGDIAQYSASEIGSRPKVVNDKTVKSVINRITPNVVFYEPDEQINIDNGGYRYFQIPSGIEDMFSISGQGKSALTALEDLLRDYTYATESISISCIPIYYLEPNSRIYVDDEDNEIKGDYIIRSISIPLQYNGTMSITAEKAAQNLL